MSVNFLPDARSGDGYSSICDTRADIGNGTYEPLYGQQGAPPAQAPVNYGATGGNYIR